MKKLLASLLLCAALIGCDTAEHFDHGGHKYIKFHSAAGSSPSVVHDPDCPCMHRHAEHP
jgi:hypothetical protein